jgi:glutamine amidotransferase
MQMLATEGYEGGACEGLNLIPGTVKNLVEMGCHLRVPHVGWNDVSYKESAEIFTRIPQKTDFYFVHSFAFVTDNPDHVLATTSYDIDITAVVGHNHIMGCQFHPEKSSKAGLQLLRNFVELSPC